MRGVYNHGWIIGDESAIAAAVQARIDTLWRSSPSRPEPSEHLMAEAEQPERLRGDREVTVDDVRQLVASATPHFAYQIRNRIRKLVAALPADDPVRLYAEAEIAKMESLGFTGEVRGTPEQPGMGALASVNETEQPRYLQGATRLSARLAPTRARSWRAALAAASCDFDALLALALRATSGRHAEAARNVVLTILFAQLLARRAATTARRTRRAPRPPRRGPRPAPAPRAPLRR